MEEEGRGAERGAMGEEGPLPAAVAAAGGCGEGMRSRAAESGAVEGRRREEEEGSEAVPASCVPGLRGEEEKEGSGAGRRRWRWGQRKEERRRASEMVRASE